MKAHRRVSTSWDAVLEASNWTAAVVHVTQNLQRKLLRPGTTATRLGRIQEELRTLSPLESPETLEDLFHQLRRGTYTPGPVRLARLKKRSGGVRRLRIHSVRDRLIARAIHQIMSPLLDSRLHSRCCAFRPGRGPQDAAPAAAQALTRLGQVQPVRTDIARFFDRIRRDRLFRVVRALARLETSLEAFLVVHLGGAFGVGIPQGSPLSPLMANLYLLAVDERANRGCHRTFRYADDQLIVSPDPGRALRRLRRELRRVGLRLNPGKLATTGAVRWLGYELTPCGRVRVPPDVFRRSAADGRWGPAGTQFRQGLWSHYRIAENAVTLRLQDLSRSTGEAIGIRALLSLGPYCLYGLHKA